MARRTVAIMQPTYLPWLGYFDLMDQCQCFVFLDSVQFAHRSWQQRNRIKSPQGELMLTVPVICRGKRDQRVYQVEIDQTRKFQTHHLKTVEHCYGKARYFREYYEELSCLLNKPHQQLSHLTIELIMWLAKTMGIEAELIKSSLLDVQGRKMELLVAICQAMKGERYLSPVGARDYIADNDVFARHGIELVYHQFEHPCYAQLYGEFIPYLSVIDLLFNEGGNSLAIIRSGRRNG